MRFSVWPSARSSIPTLSHQLLQNAFLSMVFSVLGIGKSRKAPNLMNIMIEAWLRFCFWSKNHEDVLMCELVLCRDVESIFSTIPIVSAVLLYWYANILCNFPDSNLTTFQNYFFLCFDVFYASWRDCNSRTLNIISVFYKALLPLINRQSRLDPNAIVNILSALEHLIPFLT